MIDLEAYFKRIGYDGDRKPTLATLRELHRLHPQSIAFENLSPLLGEGVPLDPEALHAKMVAAGRGGYCYEQNLLFGSVLDALGFNFRHVTGWPRWDAGATLPRTHLLLLIDIDGEPWIADVGFGGNTLTGPLMLNSDKEQPTPHESVRVRRENGGCLIQVRAGEWRDLIYFDLVPQNFVELEVGNWFTSTNPQSRFKKNLVVARPSPKSRYALLDNNLSIRSLDGKSERRKLTDAAELRDALTDLFHIRLPEAPGLQSVLARFAKMP